MRYIIGVDGGGTKTNAVVTDETGSLVGFAREGNGNHQIDYEEAKENIRLSLEGAMKDAGIEIKQVEKICFGLAGADRNTDFDILHRMLAELALDRSQYVLYCDTIIGLRAGTDKPYGISIICGTGSNCVGLSPSGQIEQVGSFSYMYGDIGGGGRLSVEAFRSVIRAWDGRDNTTMLTPLVLNHLGYDSVERMFHDFLDRDASAPKDLAKLLFSAANEGDKVSLDILKRHGEELGKSAAAVIRKLRMESLAFDVVLAGSVVTRGQGDFLTRYIKEAVLAAAPAAQVKKLRFEPAAGAVLLAMEAAGMKIDQEIKHHLMTNLNDLSQDAG